MHLYEIIFNQNPKHGKIFSGSFGRIEKIDYHLEKDKGYARFLMKTKKDFQDFEKLQIAPLKNIFSKIFMCHLFLFGKSINMNSITFRIDGEEKTYKKDYSYFPFVFSMFDKKTLKVQGWDGLCEDFCKKTKTKIAEDSRYIAVYSFLLSRTREYAYDRFQNLWTAMNAYYNYIAYLFEKEFFRRNRFKINKLKNGQHIVGSDKLSIGALAYILNGKYQIIDKNKHKKRDMFICKRNL